MESDEYYLVVDKKAWPGSIHITEFEGLLVHVFPGPAPDLQRMQEIVGGLIEAIDIGSEDSGFRKITLWLNEEGKLMGLEPMVCYEPYNDVLVGPLIITAVNMRTGDTECLSADEVTNVRIGGRFMIFNNMMIPGVAYDA